MQRQRLWEGVLSPALVLAAWYIATNKGIIDPFFFPAPQTVWRTFVEMLGTGEYGRHLSISLWRIVAAFTWAAGLGIPLGLLVGLSGKARRVFDPLLQLLRQIPPIAWIPLFILWLGIGEGSKLAVIIYAALFPIFLNTVLGISTIGEDFVEVARMLELSPMGFLVDVVLPGALPSILVGLRLGLSNSWRALVAAEMVAAASGLGYIIMAARSLVRPEEMLVGILSIGVLGLFMDRLFLWGIARVPWAKSLVR